MHEYTTVVDKQYMCRRRVCINTAATKNMGAGAKFELRAHGAPMNPPPPFPSPTYFPKNLAYYVSDFYL